jgi:hypothetical protein
MNVSAVPHMCFVCLTDVGKKIQYNVAQFRLLYNIGNPFMVSTHRHPGNFKNHFVFEVVCFCSFFKVVFLPNLESTV